MKDRIVPTHICRTEDLTAEIREVLATSVDHICCKDGMVYLQYEQTVICLPDSPGRNELLSVLSHRIDHIASRPANEAELFGRLLNDPGYLPENVLLKTLGIKSQRRRCIIVFRSFSPLEKDFCSVLNAMAPVEAGDSVIPVDYHTAAFVKDLEGQSVEELKEFTQAVIGTLEAEGVSDIKAGIGREYKDIKEMRASFLEGKQSLQLGIRYHRQDHVYVYADQTLERIVDSIPEQQKQSILQTFFGNSSVNGISDEMLDTIRVFFQNDLNLTAASKQLYIHRNTLNYRLDKIKKDYGLDLRSFRDAVVFRIIYEITSETKINECIY